MGTHKITSVQRAETLLFALFEAAGDGCHYVTVAAGTATAAAVPFHNEGNKTYLGGGDGMDDTVITTSYALDGDVTGVVLRTNEEDGSCRVWGWRLTADTTTPLTAEELRVAYSTNARTGELLPPIPGQRFELAPCLNLH